MPRPSPLPLVLLLAAAPALAQEAATDTTTTGDSAAVVEADGATTGAAPAADGQQGPYLRASELEDVTIYTLAEEYDADFWNSGEPFGAIAAAWTEIGEVEDVILDNEGRVAGVSADIGGFLGIGENEVLLPFDDIRLVQMPDQEELFVVTRLSEEQLEEREEIQTLWED